MVTIKSHNKTNVMTIKWKTNGRLEFDTSMGKETRKRTFQIVHNITSNNKLKWFQMKILYRILGTRQHLAKLGINDDGICQWCHTHEENILHMFVQCPEVSSFWETIESHIKEKTGITIKSDSFNISRGKIRFNPQKIATKGFSTVFGSFVYTF